MKTLFTLSLVASFANASPVHVHAPEVPHMELDMTGAEYAPLLQQLNLKSAAGDALQDMLQLGAKNLSWVNKINSTRPANQQLDLWTPENTVAFPITAPRFASRPMIQSEIAQLANTVAPEFKKVVFTSAAIPADFAGMTEEKFLENARETDRIYQRASRWLLQEPMLFQYASLARYDLRGLYYLNSIPNLDTVLLDYKNQTADKKTFLNTNLVILCTNSRIAKATCLNHLKTALDSDGHPLNFKKQYWANSVELWNSYFELSNARSDVKWTSAEPNRIQMPFRTPATSEIGNWFELNVEDEWKLLPVRLDILFSSSARANVTFSPGATPNVNGIGGDRITMDSNRPLQQYATRWTIRHEFGHVLGLPDCYLEFYDQDQKVMINYQLDVTNLMCSRRGHLLPTHVEQLKKNYFKR